MIKDALSIPYITSKSNQYIKEARLLKTKKERDQKGLFLIEGLRLAEEAVASKQKIKYALITERIKSDTRGLKLLEELKEVSPLYQVDEGLLNYCGDTEHAQGIILVAGKRPNLPEVLKEGSFFVIADRIADPGNLGTLSRTALAVGADSLILLPGTVDYYNPKVVRSSMGAVFYLPAYLALSREDVYGLMKERGVGIISATANGRTPYYDADLTVPLAWVFGSESEGVDPFWVNASHDTVYLPMESNSESLNVAVSAGVLLYDTMRQRKKNF